MTIARTMLIALLGTAAACPGAAMAQEALPTTKSAPSDGGEIVVTARKRSEALSKIPESVQALSADTLAAAGVTSVNDLGRQIPNVVLNRRQDNEPNVVIRGVGSFGNTQGIGFYIDDVQNFTDQTAAIQDVERVEVLKGPVGTLYGGSNVGGAIKYILKKPGETLKAEFAGSYGTFDSFDLYGAVGGPLSDSFGARISGYFNGTDGFIDNVNLGNRPDRSREWGTRLAVRWEPAPSLTVDASYRHSHLENGGNVYVLAGSSDDYVRQVDYNTDVYNRRTIDGGIVQLNYAPGGASLTSVTSYTVRKTRFLWDLDYSSADVISAFTGINDKTKVFTQELRIASDDSSAFDWLIGAYYANVKDRDLTANADAFAGVDHPIGPLFIPALNGARTRERQYALFATANYDLGDVRIGGGVRINRTEFSATITNTTPMLYPKVKDTLILPKITLAYDVTPSVMLFANAAFGSEPGRANIKGDGVGVTYRPEKAWNFEAGVKGETPDRLLSYELTAYYITYRDRQQETQVFDSNGVITELITNIGDSESYGLEGALRVRPVERLSLAVSAGYLHSTWKNGTYNGVSVSGLDVPYSPELTFNASAEYRQPVAGNLELGLRADIYHTSSFRWKVDNAQRQDGYDLVGLRASLGDAGGKWEAAVRVENLFDQKYYNEFVPDVFGPNQGAGAPGMPRRVFGSISFNF